MGSMEEGVKQAIENCLKVKKGENVVVITDRETLGIGSALREAAQKSTRKPAQFFVMEDFGTRPIQFPQEIKRLDGGGCDIYAAQEPEAITFRQPMIRD
jgi:hypothetical protein